MLIRLTAALGFAGGIATAAGWHWTRTPIDGWTLYAPLNNRLELPTHHPGWWPTLVIFPVVGAILGALPGYGLRQLGWVLVRPNGTAGSDA